MGFELNPYDLCAENANIEGKQCTVCCYVDDNKIRHVDPKVVDKVIDRIEGKFGKIPQTRGDEHNFLGTNIKFKDKKLKICMKKHIQKASGTFTDDITRNLASPATSYLFKTRKDAKLSGEKSENFHNIEASLLFISSRCRLDIQTAVDFPCTIVAEPNEDNWKKLKLVLQYLKGPIDLVLNLGADVITKN